MLTSKLIGRLLTIDEVSTVSECTGVIPIHSTLIFSGFELYVICNKKGGQ
jgi:hypothetical protein